MGKHNARWNWSLAPTLALTAIVSCGVAGVAIGQTFVRPSLEFGTSAQPNAAAGGQAGSVELNTPHAPAPAGGSRTGGPRPVPVRDLPTPQPSTAPTASATSTAEPTTPPAPKPSASPPAPTVAATPGWKCKERGE